MNNHILYILTGPTAVGKSNLAIQLAEKNNCEIISCDSLLVYKEMNIGTDKPSINDLNKIVHHCINITSLNEAFSIKKYQNEAIRSVEKILKKNKNVLITGGSGFYLKSFFNSVFDDVLISNNIIDKVLKIFNERGLSGLVETLKAINFNERINIDLKNPRRVMRALEKCLETGKTINVLFEEFNNQISLFKKYQKKVIMIDRSKDSLKQRIELRLKKMLREGFIEEVKNLKKNGLMSNLSASNAIGYKEILSFLEKETDINTLENLIVKNTMKLVKKQKTWFRHNLKVDVLINLDNESKINLNNLF